MLRIFNVTWKDIAKRGVHEQTFNTISWMINVDLDKNECMRVVVNVILDSSEWTTKSGLPTTGFLLSLFPFHWRSPIRSLDTFFFFSMNRVFIFPNTSLNPPQWFLSDLYFNKTWHFLEMYFLEMIIS